MPHVFGVPWPRCLRQVLPRLLSVSLGFCPGIAGAQLAWAVDSSEVDPMDDRRAVFASIGSTDGATMLLTLSCTIQGDVAVFIEGAKAIQPDDVRFPLPGGYYAAVRMRFDKSAPVSGRAVVARGQPSLLGFHTSTFDELITHRVVARRMQSAKVLWVEYLTYDGTTRTRFDIPGDTRAVVRRIYRRCGASPPSDASP